MLSFFVLAALIGAPENPPAGMRAVGGLLGCWKAPGSVRGEPVVSVARGEWHLGGRYFMLQLRSVGSGEPYSAAILYGAGEQPNAIGSYWLDTFGGAATLPVSGSATADGFNVEYRFPDSLFVNRFLRTKRGWRWTITEQAQGKPARLFAEYTLTPTKCRGLKFDF